MTRLLAILVIGAGALYYLDKTGTVRLSGGGGGFGGGSGSSAIQGYSNSAKPAITGIVKAAGG